MPSNRPSLVLAGRIEAIPLPDVLQILAAARHDGVLELEREDPPERGEIELVAGRVVRAVVGETPERIGVALVRRRLLDPDALGEALRRQSASYAWRPLAEVLLEMGALDEPTLAAAAADEIGDHVAALLSWQRGVFRFRALARDGACEPALRGLALDPRELLLVAAHRADIANGAPPADDDALLAADAVATH